MTYPNMGTSATAKPGYVPATSQLPAGQQTDSASQWSYDLATTLATNLYNLYTGSGQIGGMPASWSYGPITPNDFKGGGVTTSLWTKLQTFANSQQAASDADLAAFMGRPKPAAQAGDWVASPETTAAALAAAQYNLNVRQQDFAEAKFAIQLAMEQAGSSNTRSSGGGGGSITPRVSGGYGGGGGAVESMSEYQQAQIDLAQQQLAWEKEYALGKLSRDDLQQKLDNDYRNRSLGQDQSQFESTLAYNREKDQKAEGLARAKTISDYSANPGDAVAREYFLRQQGQEPQGTPVDIFTGQAAPQQMTFSQMLKAQAPQLAPFAQAGMTGAPPLTTALPPQTPPQTPPETPQYGRGTDPNITPDGWTRASQFIAGDPQRSGQPNPEMIQLRNGPGGQPQAKVTPISQMLRGAPMYARGTGTLSSTDQVATTYGDDNQVNQLPAGTTATPTNTQDPLPAGYTNWQDYALKNYYTTTTGPNGRGGAGTSTVNDPYANYGLTSTYYRDRDGNITNSPDSKLLAADKYSTFTFNTQADLDAWKNEQYYSEYAKRKAEADRAAANAANPYLQWQADQQSYMNDVMNGGMDAQIAAGVDPKYATAGVWGGGGNPIPIGNEMYGPGWDTPGGGTSDVQVARGGPNGQQTYVNGQLVSNGELTDAQLSQGKTQSDNPNGRGYVPPAGFPTAGPNGEPIVYGPTSNRVADANGNLVANPAANQNAGQAAQQPQPNIGGAKPSVAGYWGNTPLQPGRNDVTSDQAIPVDSISVDLNSISLFDPKTQTWRNPVPGEVIPAGTAVSVNMPAGAKATTTGGPGGVQVDGNGVGVGDGKPWADGPEGAQSGGAASGGYTTITSPATVKTSDGYGTINLAGDGSEFKGPDGRYYRWNGKAMRYEPLTIANGIVPTVIASVEQFMQLPPALQAKIRNGLPVEGIMLADGGIDTTAMAPELAASMGLQPGRQYPGGWVSQLFIGEGPQGQGAYTGEEFRALPIEQQWNLLHTQTNDPRTFQNSITSPGSQVRISQVLGAGQQPTGYQVPVATNREQVDYWQYVDEAMRERLVQYENGGRNDSTGWLMGDTTGAGISRPNRSMTQGPRATATRAPSGPSVPPPPGGGSAPPPPTSGTGGGTPATPPVGGTTTPPDGGGGATTPPAGGTGTPNPNPTLSELLAGINALSYGPDAYNNLPGLQYLRGIIDEGQYDSISSAPVEVPALGLVGDKALPAPNTLNATQLQYMKENNPDGFALLNALYTAAGKPLTSFMPQIQGAAPAGQTFQPTLISV